MLNLNIHSVIDASIFVVAIISIYKGICFFFATNGYVQGSEFGMQITIVNELALFLIMFGWVRLKDLMKTISKALLSLKRR